MAAELYDKNARAAIKSITSQGSGYDYSFDTTKQDRGKEYFSGANARVYFGSVWMESIAGIQFSMNEQVAPIYGFHSYTFDRISRGQRIVQGSFTLNFTENGYLQTVLDRIALELRRGFDAAIDEQSSVVRTSFATPDGSAYAEENTIEKILAADNENSYEDYLSSLRKSFWGESDGTRLSRQGEQKESDVYFYARESGALDQNPLKEHGFNILIDYSPDANLSDFEACIRNLKAPGTGSFHQTYRTIMGVHIVGITESLANDGQVLQQHYQFIARDLDGDITEPSLMTNYLNDSYDISFVLPSNEQEKEYASGQKEML